MNDDFLINDLTAPRCALPDLKFVLIIAGVVTVGVVLAIAGLSRLIQHGRTW